jgi:hypothetical protein
MPCAQARGGAGCRSRSTRWRRWHTTGEKVAPARYVLRAAPGTRTHFLQRTRPPEAGRPQPQLHPPSPGLFRVLGTISTPRASIVALRSWAVGAEYPPRHSLRPYPARRRGLLCALPNHARVRLCARLWRPGGPEALLTDDRLFPRPFEVPREAGPGMGDLSADGRTRRSPARSIHLPDAPRRKRAERSMSVRTPASTSRTGHGLPPRAHGTRPSPAASGRALGVC